MCDRPEIGPAVICLISIAVVDLVVRPLVGHPQMGKLAGGVAATVDPDVDAVISERAGHVASIDPASLFQPGEHTRYPGRSRAILAAARPPVWDASSAPPPPQGARTRVSRVRVRPSSRSRTQLYGILCSATRRQLCRPGGFAGGWSPLADKEVLFLRSPSLGRGRHPARHAPAAGPGVHGVLRVAILYRNGPPPSSAPFAEEFVNTETLLVRHVDQLLT